jgi:hypothetical protein
MGHMPYPWEKGYFPTAIENWFNEGLDAIGPNDTAVQILTKTGPKNRLRAIWRYASVCRQLREGEANPATIRRVTKDNSIIFSGLFPTLSATPNMVTWADRIAHDWFGMEQVGADWYRQTPATWAPSKSLGHWNGYFGNVELILCETLQRMLELSLGLDHLDPASLPSPVPTPGQAQQIETKLRTDATCVWPVYVFLSCPNAWFESWVTWQCHDTASAVRGQVTVVLATPGHDRPVTPSPIDLERDEPDLTLAGATTTIANPYYLHGRDQKTPNHGYEGDFLTGRISPGAGSTAPSGPFTRTVDPPVGPAAVKGGPRTNHQGMWTVTHANHDSTIVWNNFPNPTSPNWGRPGLQAWDLPPFTVQRCADVDERRDLGGVSNPNVLTGLYDVVVVQPAAMDGGVW